MPVEDINTQAWSVYGQRQLARAYTPPIPDRMSWAPWEGAGRELKSLATSPAAASWTSVPGPATTPSISPRLTALASPESNCRRPSTNAPSPATRTFRVCSSARET